MVGSTRYPDAPPYMFESVDGRCKCRERDRKSTMYVSMKLNSGVVVMLLISLKHIFQGTVYNDLSLDGLNLQKISLEMH